MTETIDFDMKFIELMEASIAEQKRMNEILQNVLAELVKFHQ